MAAILFRPQNVNLHFNISLDQNGGDIADDKDGLPVIKHMFSKVWVEIAYSSPNFHGIALVQPSKFVNGYVTSSHTLLACDNL